MLGEDMALHGGWFAGLASAEGGDEGGDFPFGHSLSAAHGNGLIY
jgi:hypothetical protein